MSSTGQKQSKSETWRIFALQVHKFDRLLANFLFQYTYTSDTENIKTANLEVVWNDDYLIDDDFATEGICAKCRMLCP